MRAVIQAAGINNVLTKSIGTTNPHNVVKATIDALKQLKNRESIATLPRQNGAGTVRTVLGTQYSVLSQVRILRFTR